MEEALFKWPISLFWPERVRKLVTPVLGNRPSAVSEAVSAHGPKRPTKLAGSRFPNGQRAVLGPVVEIGVRPFSGPFFGLCAKHSQKRAATVFKTGPSPVWRPFVSLARTADKTGWVPFPKLTEGRFETRLRNRCQPNFGIVPAVCPKHTKKQKATCHQNSTVINIEFVLDHADRCLSD
jgi:hypothetical protein